MHIPHVGRGMKKMEKAEEKRIEEVDVKDMEMEVTAQKENQKLCRKAAYAGAGTGLVLFAIFGLLPGSLLGGTLGLKLTGKLFGSPVVYGVLPRVLVGLSMLAGVMLACTAFVLIFSALGWLVGMVVDTAKSVRKPEVEEI